MVLRARGDIKFSQVAKNQAVFYGFKEELIAALFSIEKVNRPQENFYIDLSAMRLLAAKVLNKFAVKVAKIFPERHLQRVTDGLKLINSKA